MHFARETAGAARTRLSLRPLFSGGTTIEANLGRIVPRDRERIPSRLFENLNLRLRPTPPEVLD
jgi:hypothetical protein